MYPYLRLIKTLIKARLGSSLNLHNESIVKMRVFPGDIDFYPELNNGRHLTMMDFGRMDLGMRTGLLRAVHKNKWGLAVGGASVRYRHRIKAFQRYRLHSRITAIDDRWFYFHQYTFSKGKIHSSALIRAAVTSREGIVPVIKVLETLGIPDWDPGMPDWVKAWAESDLLRPWDE